MARYEHFVSWLVHSDFNENDSDSTDDDINESGLKECERNDLDTCLLDPEEQYNLPRSSPVISRKRYDAELKTEKQASPSSAYGRSKPSTFLLKKEEASISNSNRLEVTHSEKLKEPMSVSCNDLIVVPHKNKDSLCTTCHLGHNDPSKDFLEQSDFSKSKSCADGMSPDAQILSHSIADSARLRVPLNIGFQSRGKKRACSDIPPASTQRSPGHARKHGTFIDLHSSEDIHMCSLDEENAHFVVVDMVLEVLESVKWVMCLEEQLKCKDPAQDKHEMHSTTKTDSLSSVDSGFEDDSTLNLPSDRYSLASFQSSQSSSMPRSAEDLAHHLVSEFRKQWVSAVQQKNPDNLNIAPQEYPFPMAAGDRINLTEEIKQKSRMRGTLTWAPPRFQIIFCVQPTHRRSDVIASQHYLCAGCGTEVEPRYMKKLRYCDYLGKYFCEGCHGGEESVILARILSNWDFARYPVCNFSRQLLDSIWHQPLLRLTSVAKNLYNQAKELQRFKDLQEQLISIKKLLSTCRLSDGVLSEFEQLPGHLLQELHLFSMDDLIRVKKGQLCNVAKDIFQSATAHIDTCELCQAKGFICEFCHGTDILFPFQRDTCTRCQDCRACFHISCFQDEACPRCARLQKRKKHQEDRNT